MLVADGGTMPGRGKSTIKGHADGREGRVGRLRRAPGGKGAMRAQGEVSTERGGSRMPSTSEDDGGTAEGGRDGCGAKGGARGGAWGCYANGKGAGRGRSRKSKDGTEGAPGAHHVALCPSATVTVPMCCAQGGGSFAAFLANFKPGKLAISQEDVKKQKEAQSKRHLLLIAKSGGAGTMADSKNGNKTRQSLVAALGERVGVRVDDPRVIRRPRTGGMEEYEYLGFTTDEAGLEALLAGAGQAEYKGIKYVKYFGQGGDDKEDRNMKADCVVAAQDDFLSVTGVGIRRDQFEEQDPGEVMLAARITMDHNLGLDSAPVRDLLGQALQYVLGGAMLVAPRNEAEAEHLDHWTVRVEGMRASTETTSVGGKAVEMQHGLHAQVRCKWTGAASEMDQRSLALPTRVILPARVEVDEAEGSVGLPVGDEWKQAKVVWMGSAARNGCLMSVAGVDGGGGDGAPEQVFYVLGGQDGVEVLRQEMQTAGRKAEVEGKEGWQRGAAQDGNKRGGGNVRRRGGRADDDMTMELIDALEDPVGWKWGRSVGVCRQACQRLAKEEREEHTAGGGAAGDDMSRRVYVLRGRAALRRGATRDEPLEVDEDVWTRAVCGRRGGCEGRMEPCKQVDAYARMRERQELTRRWDVMSPPGGIRHTGLGMQPHGAMGGIGEAAAGWAGVGPGGREASTAAAGAGGSGLEGRGSGALPLPKGGRRLNPLGVPPLRR